MFKRFAAAVTLCLLASAAFALPNDLEARRKALDSLLAEQWEENLKLNPEFASILGDKRYNDQLSKNTPASIAENYKRAAEWKKRFEAIDTAGFPEQEALNKTLMVRELDQFLANQKFKNWEMPVTQFYGIHIQAPSFVQYLAFETVKDYEDYIARLNQFPRVFDETIALMRQGMADRLMPPKILLEKVTVQSESIAKQAAEATPFANPFTKFPETIAAADQKRLREAGLAAVRTQVLPAYGKFTAFVRDEYAPKGRSEPGVWALPDGPARYAALACRD